MTRASQLLDGMTETELVSRIIELARMYRWLAVHFRPAQTGRGWRTAIQGDAGSPDLMLAHEERGLIIVECKVGKNKPTKAQAKWLAVLNEIAVSASRIEDGKAYFPLRVYVWRETQLQTIANILAGQEDRNE